MRQPCHECGSEVKTGVTCADNCRFRAHGRSHLTMEPVELPTRAATHDTAGVSTDKEKALEKVGTQNVEEVAIGRMSPDQEEKYVSSLSGRLPSAWLSDCMPVGLVQPSHSVRRHIYYAPRWTSCSLNAPH